MGPMDERGSSPAPSRRHVALFLLAVGGLAASITLVFLGMRAVLDVGGACAEGGPYVVAQHCPEGSALAMFIGVFGIFGWGGLGLWAGSQVGGLYAGLPFLAWSGLFMSLGWNFLEYGVSPPGGRGWEWGWLVPGVLFELMGAIPLLVALWARAWVRRVVGAQDRPWPGRSASGSAALFEVARRQREHATNAGKAGGEASGTEADPEEPPNADLVNRIERLTSLHDRGDLSDEEFAAAKSAILGLDGRDAGR
jgi:hypothetical protein